MRMRIVLPASLLAALAGCVQGDFTTVTIEYSKPAAQRAEHED